MKIKIKLPHWKFLTVVLLFLTAFAVLYSLGVKRANRYDLGKESFKEVVINKGASVEEISKILDREDLINSRALFKLYVYLSNKSLQAGNFYVPTNISVVELANLLGKGSFQKKYTFLEGWRVEQMAELLPKDIQNEFLKSSYTKEGFMFPDTYFFLESAIGEEIAQTLSQTFEDKIKVFDKEIKASSLSLEEIVILASIIEREAKSFDEKATIAGILVKRYQNGWPLQADATIQYAKDLNAFTCASLSDCVWWRPLFATDLDIESSYNTYKYAGLPPTPICSPGLESIRAVLEYKETPYWFYLTGNDGVTRFSETVEEQTANIQKYL
ncbi:MAG: endolytic transglycosylase MltG [Patescibacteria group bacterium]